MESLAWSLQALEPEDRKLLDEYEFGEQVGELNDYSRRELRAYQPRLTAFIDIIGFAQLVRRMKQDDETRERLLRALRKLAACRTKKLDDLDLLTDQRVSCFSDSILISYPFYHSDDLIYLIQDVISLTADMIDLGLAVRGGIAMARLHHTPGIVIGDALIDSYMLENTIAIHPRVILSPEVMRAGLGIGEETTDVRMEEWIQAGRKDAELEKREYTEFPIYLHKDEDGQYFVDHLGASSRFNDGVPEEHFDYLVSVRRLIDTSLEQLTTAERLDVAEAIKRRRKWEWYARYYNRALGAIDHDQLRRRSLALFRLDDS